MQDRPTAAELLDAIRECLEKEIVPGLSDPRLRYQGLIAVNVLRIVGRDVAGEESRLQAEAEALRELLGGPPREPQADPALLRRHVGEANRELCQRIRGGEADGGPWRERVVAHVQASVAEKLRINNPAQLGAGPRGE